jgi:hypothetical protein
MMERDLRDRPHIDHGDIEALNFIRAESPYLFRRHFRNGMRSHVMEVLPAEAVARETSGMMRDGVRWFPRATPLYMLRLFRRRFDSLDQALEEIRRVRIIEAYLARDQLARSDEFIVTYRSAGGSEILLCGFQEYAAGQALDPWQPVSPVRLARRLLPAGTPDPDPSETGRFETRFRANVQRFADSIKTMAAGAGLIPDLAGIRNMVATREGNLRLVDINNVSRVSFDRDILLDDKGYPVCDKSVEALWRMEQAWTNRDPDPGTDLYRHFLTPGRMARVRETERRFYCRIASETAAADGPAIDPSGMRPAGPYGPEG